MGLSSSSHFGKTVLRSNPVNTEYGAVIGKKFDIGNDRFVNAFLGVPFAKPPVGDLRFKKPQPPSPWRSPRLCVVHGPRSPQKELIFEKLAPTVVTSEDCLYLNVFAPEWETPKEQPNGRAVLIFIHGGGFVMHSSANYGDVNICRNLCSREVVVVTIQYRLGLLGFCATGDQNSIPNLGLWDQAMAIRWVKENIANFLGDPSNITLFGQSAGGASVDMLCLSPHTNGLFSKVIPMGGSASCGWATIDVAEVREATVKFAQSSGWKCPDKGNSSEVNKNLMEFLKKQSSKKLGLGLTSTKRTEQNPYGMFFVPVIDGDFLPEPIPELRKKTPKKLCITGTADYEGLLFVALAKKYYGLKKLRKIIPTSITEAKFMDYEDLRKRAAALYFKDVQTKNEQARAYVKLLGDIFITNGVHEFAHDMTLAGHTVYLYNFVYCNPESFGFLGLLFPFKAATHTSELPYLFAKGLLSNFRPSLEDQRVVDKFTTLVTNFAIFGDPNGKETKKIWDPLSPEDTFKYLSVDREFSMKSNFENRRTEFWRELKKRALLTRS